MKNQYVCDIGDYGKYSLLRAFIDEGVRVGVNWYLTDDDGSTDGKFKAYLEKDDMGRYDPVIFDGLNKIYSEKGNSVADIENSGILPRALFYHERLLPLRRNGTFDRAEWFGKSLDKLNEAELIFMDPNNGLLENKNIYKVRSEKFALPDEVKEYYSKGHDVVYYCHKGRRTQKQWQSYKSMMRRVSPDAKMIVLTYHKGAQRSYIFLIHEEHYSRYRKITEKLIGKWDGVFEEETVSNENKLIMIRGNSGSGKTSAAKLLQHRFGRNTLLISQDMVRREILYAEDGYNTTALPLITELLRYGHENSSVTILEGILHSGYYRPMFETIKELYGENVFAYYYDLPFEETLKRHESRDKRAEFGEKEMREWWNEKDVLDIIPERLITKDVSLDETVERIYSDVAGYSG